jgi:hypothetical protein
MKKACLMCDDRKTTIWDIIEAVLEKSGKDLSIMPTAAYDSLCDVHQDIYHEEMAESMISKTGCCFNDQKHILCCREICNQCKNKNHRKCQLEDCNCGFCTMDEEKYSSENTKNNMKANHVKVMLLRLEMISELSKNKMRN